MPKILPFPTAPRKDAPPFLIRAKALQEVTRHLHSATLDLSEEIGNLLDGDRPTDADHSASGKVAAELGEAIRLLILTNGLPAKDEAFAVSLNAWLARRHGR